MDNSTAWKILGLDENSSKRQVENRFANLTRRVRNGEDLDFELIRQAYDHLMGNENYESSPGRINLLFRKFMFDYHGFVILIGVSVLTLAMIIVPIITGSFPDLTVSFAGRYGTISPETLEAVLHENLPETKKIIVEVIFLDTDSASGEFDSAGRTRLSGLLISEEADVLIVDDETFNFIRSDNALMPLDDIIEELSIDIPSEDLIYGVDFDTGEKRVYGIKSEDSYLVYRTIYGDAKRIITVAAKSMHLDDVKKVIELIITYRSE